MSANGRVLLLVGSAKQSRSTSESLGTCLVERLRDRGFEPRVLFLHKSLRADESREELLSEIDGADLLVLAFPLYVDALPYLVTKTLELAADRRAGKPPGRKRQWMACIVNSGFPEAHQNDTAVGICRLFARKAGFEWAGGLALGGGGMIDGRPLQALGGRVRNVIRSLDLAAAALAEGKPAPQEAIELMGKPGAPAWMYMLIGGIGWWLRARKQGVARKLLDRPYENV